MSDQTRDYRTKWEQFARLLQTQDSLASERRGWRRWLLLPYIAFVLPIEDPAVISQIAAWQQAFLSRLNYDPQPLDRLHITLHYVGLLRRKPWLLLPNSWRKSALPQLAERARSAIESCSVFEVKLGPLNAFPNVLFAEVQDERECLRRFRLRLRRVLPLQARPPLQWTYLPHLSLGYWGRQAAAPLVDILRPYRHIEPIPLRITSVKLTVYYRDTAPLGRELLTGAAEEVIAEFHLNEGESGDGSSSC